MNIHHHDQPTIAFQLFGHSAARLATSLIASIMILVLTSCGPKPTPFHVSVPTPYCGTSTLTIGSSSFSILPLEPSSNGFLDVPPDSPATIFWINGTSTNYVFVAAPSGKNLSMEKSFLDSIAGQTAKVTWTNCNSETYTLSAAQPGTRADSTMPDQSTQGITIFFEQDASGALYIVKGEVSGEVISTIDTPTPGGLNVQAEISLLETKPSADGKSISISVSILNTGQTDFTLSAKDVSLTAENGQPAAPASSKPGLPQTFKPNAKKDLTFTFPRPSSSTATLQIFEVQYDIEGY